MSSQELESSQQRIVVGLGNPGRVYRNNRHNIGFMVVDELARKHDLSFRRAKQKLRVASGVICGRPIIVAKPMTFMNRSGDAVANLVRYYDVALQNLLVVYDEIDLPMGALRLRPHGGSGGHNGMKSIIRHIGQEFPRLRVGVGRPPGTMDPAVYVLRDFRERQLPHVLEIVNEAVAAIETYLHRGLDLAMTRHNQSGSEQD